MSDDNRSSDREFDVASIARDLALILRDNSVRFEQVYAPTPASRSESAEITAQSVRDRAKDWSAAEKLAYLRETSLGDCRRCGLCRTRNSIVFGAGSPDAEVLFVGEAPGAEEDRRGEPFVGAAGQLLDRWLQAVGLRRESVYIANVLKCRPPRNRDPAPNEVERCAPFLAAQIRAIGPRVLVALGRHAGMLLSGRDDLSLAAMRRMSFHYDASHPKEPPGTRRVPLVVTYHPSYVLRQQGLDGEAKATETVMTDLRRAIAVPLRG